MMNLSDLFPMFFFLAIIAAFIVFTVLYFNVLSHQHRLPFGSDRCAGALSASKIKALKYPHKSDTTKQNPPAPPGHPPLARGAW